LFRSGLFTLFEKGISLVFALGTAMLLLRGLSKPDFAAWGLFLIITYFVDMARSGLLQNAMMTFWAAEPAQHRAIHSTAFTINVGFGILANLILWCLWPWLVHTWQAPAITNILPIYCLINLSASVLYHFNFLQQANVEFRGIFWASFFQRGVVFAYIAFQFSQQHPIVLSDLAWAMLLGTLLGALASMLFARRFWQELELPGRTWLLRFFNYGKYVLGTNVSTMFYKNIDKLALGNLIGPAAFAVYDAAGKVTQMVEAPSFSIAAAVFPYSARQMAERGKAGIRDLYEQSVAAILGIIAPFLAVCLVGAVPLMRLFAGPGYEDSALVLRLTAFFGLFMPFAVQFGTTLDANGRPAVNFIFTLCTALLNFVLCYLGVQRLGLMGAAWGTLVGYALSFIAMQVYLHRHYGIRWWRAFVLVPKVYRTVLNKLLKR
jgi:lipopolysaccharide exporter